MTVLTSRHADDRPRRAPTSIDTRRRDDDGPTRRADTHGVVAAHGRGRDRDDSRAVRARNSPPGPKSTRPWPPPTRSTSAQEGKNADYIPALAEVPSKLFGISLVTTTARSTTTATSSRFSIQSISKVFTLALVLQESGEQAVEDNIGVDATGQVFNSIVAIEQYKGQR